MKSETTAVELIARIKEEAHRLPASETRQLLIWLAKDAMRACKSVSVEVTQPEEVTCQS